MKNFSSLFVLPLALLLFPLSGSAQDLFDSLSTKRYADFLFQSANYNEAIEEYERLVFSFGATEDIKLRLVQSYRLSGNNELGLKRMHSLWDEPAKVSGPISKEFFSLRIINSDFSLIEYAIEDNLFLLPTEKIFLTSSAFLFRDEFRNARILLSEATAYNDPFIRNYLAVSDEALALKLKSPLLGGLMSAVVPGAGKFYTRNWEDGLISLIMVGGTAWQAYRGFSKKGTGSVLAWTYSIIGAGFYIGNIYGSVKEVNRYNHNLKRGIRIRVEAVFYNNL